MAQIVMGAGAFCLLSAALGFVMGFCNEVLHNEKFVMMLIMQFCLGVALVSLSGIPFAGDIEHMRTENGALISVKDENYTAEFAPMYQLDDIRWQRDEGSIGWFFVKKGVATPIAETFGVGIFFLILSVWIGYGCRDELFGELVAHLKPMLEQKE